MCDPILVIIIIIIIIINNNNNNNCKDKRDTWEVRKSQNWTTKNVEGPCCHCAYHN